MNLFHFSFRCLVVIFSLGAYQSSVFACDQTLDPGADVAASVKTAASGAVICLNSGNYGTVNFANISKSNYVTVKSSTTLGATISPQVSNSHYLQFENLTVSGSTISSCASNIRIADSTFTRGLGITMRNSTCSNYPLNIDIDGNIFGSMGGAIYEGRISIADKDGKQPSMGVVLRNNEIRDGCLSDGVFLAGGASGVQIGPGNVFSNIVQSGSVHCDNIQFYGSGWNNSIEGNFFNGGSTLMLIDGNDNGVIRNNVFKSTGSVTLDVQNACPSSTYPVTVEHNTFHGSMFRINYYCNATIRNNAFLNAVYSTAGSVNCSNCTASYNVSNNGTYGTNSIQGTVLFSGGSNPTTQAGYQLTTNSPGYKKGSDGNDLGTNYYGVATQPTPGTPQNLRVE